MNPLASLLWKQQCVQVASEEQPFTYSSGQKGFFYCDCRKLMTNPAIRKQVVQMFLSQLVEGPASSMGDYQTVAAVATSGIPWGMLLAEKLQKNFIYVRSKAKDYGLDQTIEGEIFRGQKVLVIEDVINRGTSIHHVLQQLQKADLHSVLVFSLLHYEKVQSEDFFGHPPILSLTTVREVIDIGVRTGYITAQQGLLAQKDQLLPSFTKGSEVRTFF